MNNVFRFEELDDSIGLLTFDTPDKKVNTLARAVLQELATVVAELEQRSDLNGLLLRSGKPGQFIAGADLNELAALSFATKEQIGEAVAGGHEIFNRIGLLPFPTVALVDGNCMGGGTELILAMDHRLAADSSKTKIALPEVNIGLIPGWGGTQRMPRVVGIHHGIRLVCTGDAVSADEAKSIGLVFDAVPADQLIEEGIRLVRWSRSSGAWEKERARKNDSFSLSADELQFATAVAGGGILQKTKGQYPAPMAALKAIQLGINQPLEKGLQAEKEVASEVFGTPVSMNLVGVFFMNNVLARDRGVANRDIQPLPVKRVGVLGAGLMGGGIATAHARSGFFTGIVDVDGDRLQAGLQQARDIVASRIKIGRATPSDMEAMLSRLSTSTSHHSFRDCDVVIEAVPENEQLKTGMYQKFGDLLPKHCILASNTSTISITRMAESAPDPQRFVGMHFFYPVDRMKLVEVIRGEKTSDETVVTIVALAKQLRKVPIVVNDCPGFLVNRILLPYMGEAVQLFLEGASLDSIDRAAGKFGMPVGPMALHDMVGLDTACFAGKVMAKAFADRVVTSPILGELVAAGRLGQKTGAGFRKFVKRNKQVDDPELQPFLENNRVDNRTFSEEELQDRLFLPMLLEATRCLQESIVREPAHVDMGLILGIGFPAFRGGLLRWCDQQGADQLLKRLDQYQSLGKRFEPTELLLEQAKQNRLFYPVPKLK